MRLPHPRGFALSGLVILAALLSGCTSTVIPATLPKPTVTVAPRPAVVASTNVYGDIAREIAGDVADVTSLINGTAEDPHSYEASAQDQLALAKADIVIQNGEGYDPFMVTMLAASDNKEAVVLSAADAFELVDAASGTANPDQASGTGQTGQLIPGDNEHFWYSFAGMDALAKRITSELAKLDPAHSGAYNARYSGFAAKILALQTRLQSLQPKSQGLGVAITEPVPMYLLEAAGLSNKTPPEFFEAIEEGTDVPPLALQQTLRLFSEGSVTLLAYNEQTAGPETERVRDAAQKAGIAVASFTETLPDGYDYFSWMNGNIDAIAAALG